MASAAEGGYLHIADFFICKGGSNWDWAMASAAKGGHLHLIEFLKERLVKTEYVGEK